MRATGSCRQILPVAPLLPPGNQVWSVAVDVRRLPLKDPDPRGPVSYFRSFQPERLLSLQFAFHSPISAWSRHRRRQSSDENSITDRPRGTLPVDERGYVPGTRHEVRCRSSGSVDCEPSKSEAREKQWKSHICGGHLERWIQPS